MDEISLSNVKIIPLKLDTKQSTDKTLTELIRQLQSASVLKGTVIEFTEEGDAIFTTNLGKFSLPNLFNLNKNDKLIIKNTLENGKLSAQLVSVNNVKNEKTEAVTLSFLKNSNQVNDKPNQNFSKFDLPTKVDINILNAAEKITGKISYLNINSLNKDSLLFKSLDGIKNNVQIEFEIHQDLAAKLPNPYQIIGEVVENGNQKQQTIRTVFGIIEVPNTNMPIGKKFILEIKSINNFNTDPLPLKNNIESFLFKINNNWPTVEHLFPELRELRNMSGQGKMIDEDGSLQTINNFNLRNIAGQGKANNITNIISEFNDLEYLPANNQKIGQPIIRDTESKQVLQNPNVQTKILNNLTIPEIQRELSKLNKKIIPKTSQEKEMLRELTQEVTKLKNNFFPPIVKNHDNYWQQTFLPFIKDYEINEQQILFKRFDKNTIRFVIDTSLSELGDIQFDGIVVLKEQNFVESFDLAVRFKNQLDGQLKSIISDIYLLNQNNLGIKGKLHFELVTEFSIDE